MTHTHTHTHTRTARIFEDAGGYYYRDDSCFPIRGLRGMAFRTIADCVRYLRDSNALREIPFTHYVRGERVRPLWGRAAK